MEHDVVTQKWNDFCIQSGIRRYCQKVCKGSCCKCTSCGNDCKNSIQCLAHLCWELQELLPPNIQKKYTNYIIILDKVSSNYYQHTGGAWWGTHHIGND